MKGWLEVPSFNIYHLFFMATENTNILDLIPTKTFFV